LPSFFFNRYLDKTEVFCPDDACSGASFPSYPFGVIGSVSGFLFGTAFVCGGARTTYKNCEAKDGINYCSKNTECVKTTGGALWCTGPKINECYTYDATVTRNWALSSIGLQTSRAYAASVVLPDGRFWVLGGADESSILKSTEFLQITETGIVKATAGPNMQEPLMSHCAALVSSNQVIVIGGFSSSLNDYSPVVRVYDFNTQTWFKRRAGPRIDSSCLNVDINGQRRVLLAGGWNNNILADTAVFSDTDYQWLALNRTDLSPTLLPFPLRSSVMIERNQKPYLLGGVTCPSKPCAQTTTGKNLKNYSN